MKKIGILFLIILFLIPNSIFATSENELLQMQEEANEIIEEIESQKLEESAVNTFVYLIFIVVAVSMLFEFFVRGYREELKRIKENGEPTKEIRIKLLIIYCIHIVAIVILWLINNYLLNITGIYAWFLIAITLYIVEIAPLFTIRIKKRKKEE